MKLLNFAAWGHVIVALFLGTIFLCAAVFTLTTTQLLFEYGPIGVSQLHYGFDTLFQLNEVAHGELSGRHLVAVILAWILLACYTMANSAQRWHKAGIAHDGLQTFCHAMIILDGIANFAFLSGEAWYWQFIFPLAIYIVLAYFGKPAIGHFQLAVLEFTS